MPKPYLERSILSPVGVSRTGVLAVAIGAAILATTTLSAPAGAQNVAQSGAVAQGRNEAPIGHRQPRARDLPSKVLSAEDRMKADQDALDKKLENSICRGC